MRPVTGKTQAQIAAEWDRIATKRASQIESGTDLSFNHVLLPTVLSLVSDCDLNSVIDVGCGAGFLTRELACRSAEVVGVDISAKSVEYAVERWGATPNLRFYLTSIEEYAQRAERPGFGLAVCNMTLMTVLDLDNVVKSVARLLKSGAHFVATITHPCFWPRYWGYVDEDWFDYSREIAIESDFRISLESCDGLVTTHIHRPLERYFAVLARAGFFIDELQEPLPPPEIERKYPAPWQYPRFIALRAVRR